MGSKTISVDDEAYDLLKTAKQPDESFSDVVKRTLGASRPRLSALAGLLSDKEGADLARAVKKMRRQSAANVAARQKKLWSARS